LRVKSTSEVDKYFSKNRGFFLLWNGKNGGVFLLWTPHIYIESMSPEGTGTNGIY